MITANGYAAAMASALDAHSALEGRTLQPGLGVSDIGYCSSKALWKHQGVAPTDAPQSRSAAHGTELHKLFVAARKDARPGLLHEVALDITLPSGLVITGHADEIDPDEPSVTDFKTVADEAAMTVLRREGSTEQQQWQRQLYYLGAVQAGLVPRDGLVRNWWADRAGQTNWGHVEQEPFDMAYVHQADEWLQAVLYAAQHGEEVPREKHHDLCRAQCPWFTHCRAGLTTDDFEVTDPELISAARRVFDGRKEEKAGKHTSEVGRRSLTVLQQSAEGDVGAFRAGPWRVRWTAINKDSGQSWRLLVDRLGPDA